MPPSSDASHSPTRFNLVVLGMHRSGTSALAGVLHHMGCAGPATPIATNDENRKGFFESRRIVRLNENLLSTYGRSWHDWRPLDPGTCDPDHLQVFHARALSTLQAEYGDAASVVLKDPRLCRLLPLWQDVLDQSDRQSRYVLIHRNPMEVAHSLSQRNKLWPSYGQLLWARHVLEAETASRGKPRVFSNYTALLNDWRAEIDRIETGLGLTLPVRPEEAGKDIDNFLSTDLYRHRVPADIQDTLDELPDRIGSAYAIFERWVAEGEAAQDYAALDEILSYFDTAAPVFAPILQEARQMQDDLDQTKRLLGQIRKEVVESSNAEQHREHDQHNTSMQIAESRQQAHYAETRLRETEATLIDQRQAIQDMILALEEKEDQIKILTATIHTRDEDLGTLARHLAKHRARNKELLQAAKKHQYAYMETRLSLSWRLTAPFRWLHKTLFRKPVARATLPPPPADQRSAEAPPEQ